MIAHHISSKRNSQRLCSSPRLGYQVIVIVMPLTYMAVLFFLASIPDYGETTRCAERLLALVLPSVQNLLHIPAYGLLAVLWISVLRTLGMTEHWSLYVALPSASAYGGITELYQLSVPGRFSSVSDFVFDTAGILVFAWLYQSVHIQYVLGFIKHRFHAESMDDPSRGGTPQPNEAQAIQHGGTPSRSDTLSASDDAREPCQPCTQPSTNLTPPIKLVCPDQVCRKTISLITEGMING
jgi:VanZ family protein